MRLLPVVFFCFSGLTALTFCGFPQEDSSKLDFVYKGQDNVSLVIVPVPGNYRQVCVFKPNTVQSVDANVIDIRSFSPERGYNPVTARPITPEQLAEAVDLSARKHQEQIECEKSSQDAATCAALGLGGAAVAAVKLLDNDSGQNSTHHHHYHGRGFWGTWLDWYAINAIFSDKDRRSYRLGFSDGLQQKSGNKPRNLRRANHPRQVVLSANELTRIAFGNDDQSMGQTLRNLYDLRKEFNGTLKRLSLISTQVGSIETLTNDLSPNEQEVVTQKLQSIIDGLAKFHGERTSASIMDLISMNESYDLAVSTTIAEVRGSVQDALSVVNQTIKEIESELNPLQKAGFDLARFAKTPLGKVSIVGGLSGITAGGILWISKSIEEGKKKQFRGERQLEYPIESALVNQLSELGLKSSLGGTTCRALSQGSKF